MCNNKTFVSDDKIKTRRIGLAYLTMLPLLGLLITFIPLKSNAVVELPFLENTSYSRVLAFGGFPDCATACPTSLATLQLTYRDYKQATNRKDLGIIFVNIRRDMPNDVSRSYIKSFHNDFESYSTKSSDTKTLYTSLALETFSADEEIKRHKGFIYLFKQSENQWQIERVFNNDVDKQTLLKHLI